MSDLVGNTNCRFSHAQAHFFVRTVITLSLEVFLARLYESTGRAIAVTTASALALLIC